MYSKEEKLKAVQLFIKYGYRVRTTVRELGYPSRPMLRQWYLEFKKNGDFCSKCYPGKRRSNYSDGYIHWYNEKRIKQSLGGLSPLYYRRKMGLTA